MNDEFVDKLQTVNLKLDEALEAIRFVKPNDRTEIDRRLAIVFTEVEKAIAYFNFYVIQAQ